MTEIVPVIDHGLGNSSYVVDLGEGQGLVVDPERDPTPYLVEAHRRNLELRWVAETHLHADFVSGARELIADGARLLAPNECRLDFDYEPIHDGDEVDLGGLTLRVIATPGHTPEHVAYLLADGTRPIALFSGGTLMAGGAARTDLVAPELTEPLARSSYRSIRDRLFTLPDTLAVYPTHGAGSFCSASPTGERITTIGQERRANPLLQAADEDEFVSRLTGDLGTFPPYFLRLRSVNQAGPTVYGPALPTLEALPPDRIEQLIGEGGQVIDVRSIAKFAAGHVPGSISIEMRDQFATWLGWVVPPDIPLALVADGDDDHGRIVWEARKVGYEHLVAYLDGGIEAWASAGLSIATIPLVDPGQIEADATIVDVRQASEWRTGHAPGAVHVELGAIVDDPTSVPGTGPIVSHCGHGQRAMTAASLIARAGHRSVAVTAVGPQAIGEALAAAGVTPA